MTRLSLVAAALAATLDPTGVADVADMHRPDPFHDDDDDEDERPIGDPDNDEDDEDDDEDDDEEEPLRVLPGARLVRSSFERGWLIAGLVGGAFVATGAVAAYRHFRARSRPTDADAVVRWEGEGGQAVDDRSAMAS